MSALGLIEQTVAHDVFFATVKAMASKNPDERHLFCHYPIVPHYDAAPNLAPDLEQSIYDDSEQFTASCVGIANSTANREFQFDVI